MQKAILVLALLIPGVLHAQAPVSKLGSGSIEERLNQLERVMDARNAAQMALLDQMSQLQDEVAELRGKTEEHAYQLEQILLRQREIYQEIDRRLATQPQVTAAPVQLDQDVANQSRRFRLRRGLPGRGESRRPSLLFLPPTACSRS